MECSYCGKEFDKDEGNICGDCGDLFCPECVEEEGIFCPECDRAYNEEYPDDDLDTPIEGLETDY